MKKNPSQLNKYQNTKKQLSAHPALQKRVFRVLLRLRREALALFKVIL